MAAKRKPKGPPADPKDKRLAVAKEDPLEHANVEGVVNPGEYGAWVQIRELAEEHAS